MAQIKIGLDFHGVIDANPKYFSGFTQEARKRGWKIYVITGGPYEKVKQELEQMNISYDEIFAIYDYYEKKGLAIKKQDGSYEIAPDLWNTIKAKYCKANNIDIQIDDSTIYGNSFLTPYCRFDNKEKACIRSGPKKLQLGQNIDQTLDDIFKIIKK